MGELNGVAPYRDLGQLIGHLRLSAGLAKQKDLAASLGVKQQTVSRWEQGLSRPRAKDLPVLARVLRVEERLLIASAGYRTALVAPAVSATSFDRPLPLHALTPEGFERFCFFLLDRHYRGRGEVRRYGGQGHEQQGIDILVKGDFGTHTFQCKRVEKFGAQKVHAAVAAQKYKATLKVLLLSTTASTEARDAIGGHKGWQLWDREDITQLLRSLPDVDQTDLVDIFFRGQRYDLLGRDEAGPLLSYEDFFKPFLADDRLFNHQWALVGRKEPAEQLINCLLDKTAILTLLVGGPGCGKTRLLREVVAQVANSHPHIAIRFVSPTDEIQAKHLELLGPGPQILVVDDAHDRGDLGVLLRYAAAHENVRLLFSLRPYGKEALKHQAATFSLSEPQVQMVPLKPLSKSDAKDLAEEVLRQMKGPVAAADSIAELTYGSPLATVLGAQIVARDKIAPPLIANAKDFQDHILGRLQDVITGKIATGQDAAHLRAILRVVALVQPIVPDDPNLLELLRSTEGVQPDDATRLLRLLNEAGVLFKRGRRYRIAPDLLAEFVVQASYVKPDGTANDRALKAFDRANAEHLRNLLVNLGRLEWRLNEGETDEGKVLRSIAPKLRWRDDYVNAHVSAVEAVAYYQPRFAIDFAQRLIKEGHGDTASVCGMLRNAAYTMQFLEDACTLLWQAGKDDDRPLHQHPRHGIRILKELAQFELNKPIEYVRRVVRFSLALLNRPNALSGAHTPFSILEGALGTEMESRSSTSRTFTITRYALRLEHAEELRNEVISALLECLSNGSARKGFLAAQTISHALRRPMHGEDHAAWDLEHIGVLERMYVALTTQEVHSIVLVRSAKSVRWHAFHGPEATRAQAQRILVLLDRDLPTRLVRALIDGWGHETYQISESGERVAHESDWTRLIEELRRTFSSAGELSEFVNHWLAEINIATHESYGSSFLFLNRLAAEVPGFALEVLQTYRKDKKAPLARYAGAALGQIIGKVEGRRLISALLKEDVTSDALRLVAEAYARRAPSEPYSEADLALLHRIFLSKEPSILALTGQVALAVAKANPKLALDLICEVDFERAGPAVHDLLMWLDHQDTIPASLVSEEQLASLTLKLIKLSSLDDHSIKEFLQRAMRVVPDAVVELMLSRLELARLSGDWSFRAIEREYFDNDETVENTGLGLLDQAGGERRLRLLLDWARKKDEGGTGGIGEVIAAMCGRYDKPLLDALLEWMKQGDAAHVEVVGAVLRCAQSTLIYEHPQFVRDALDAAEVIAESAVDEIRSALWSVTLSGARTTSPGEPFPEDLRLLDYAKQMLSDLSRADPAYEMFAELLRAAQQGVQRQRKEREALDAQDEE